MAEEIENISFIVTGVKNEPKSKCYIVTVRNMTKHTRQLLPHLFYEVAKTNGLISVWKDGSAVTMRCITRNGSTEGAIMKFLTEGLFGTGEDLRELEFDMPAAQAVQNPPAPQVPNFIAAVPEYGTQRGAEDAGVMALRSAGEAMSRWVLEGDTSRKQRAGEMAVAPQAAYLIRDAMEKIPDRRCILVAFRQMPTVADILVKTAAYKGIRPETPRPITDAEIGRTVMSMSPEETDAALNAVLKKYNSQSQD